MEEIERILHVCPDETPEMVVAESAVFLAELEGILAQLHEIVDHLALVEVHDRIPAGRDPSVPRWSDSRGFTSSSSTACSSRYCTVT